MFLHELSSDQMSDMGDRTLNKDEPLFSIDNHVFLFKNTCQILFFSFFDFKILLCLLLKYFYFLSEWEELLYARQNPKIFHFYV